MIVRMPAVEPLDVIGAVVVPVVAILVSTGIAVWLARRERTASERAHTRVEIVALVRALTDLERTAARNDHDGAREASVRFSSTLNAFTAHLEKKDLAVPRYLAIVMNRGIETGDLEKIGRTALFLSNCVDSWLRGTVTSAQFAQHTPPDTNEVWQDDVDLAGWAQAIGIETR
ncbi:hypothetical protein [Microbacterium sp. NPDC055357]